MKPRLNGDHQIYCHGLLSFTPCMLHVVNNSFYKGIWTEKHVEQLAFDLHRWFKANPSQQDFINLSESTNIRDESLLLHHLPTHWLTLAPVFEWKKRKKKTRNKLVTSLATMVGCEVLFLDLSFCSE